jgi:MFS family permease
MQIQNGPPRIYSSVMRGQSNRKVATAAVLLGLVISAFEGTVVTTAMPTITSALGGARLYAWVFTAFLLASTLGVMLVGKLGDHVGRKPVFLGGIALFLVGSSLCGLATSVPALIAFRVVQGLGAGAIQPTTMTIAADLYTLKERAVVQSVFTGVWGLANVLGPVIGGWIVGHASWRWVFLVNVPVSVVAGALLAVSYRDPERKPGHVELWGPLLAGGSVALLLLALEPETGLRIPFAVAGLLLGGLLFRQQRASAEPLLPLGYLRDRTVQAGLLGGAVAGALLYATTAYLPLWMTAQGYSALLAGLALVPMLAGWAVGSVFGVRLMIRGGMRASVGGGFALSAVGAALLALMAYEHAHIGWAFAALALLGVGLGPAASTSIIGPQSVVPWRARSVVTSAVYSTRMLGGAVAIALLHLWHGSPTLQVMLIAPVGLIGGLVLLGMAPAGRMDEVEGLDLVVE